MLCHGVPFDGLAGVVADLNCLELSRGGELRFGHQSSYGSPSLPLHSFRVDYVVVRLV